MKSSLRLPILLGAILAAAIPSGAQTSRTPWQREPDEIRRTLDSLAAASIGSYIHLAVGSCYGGRCEEKVSIHRDNEDLPYRYRAGGWVGMPQKPQFYGANRELPEEEAGMLLAGARLAGVMSLVPDSGVGDRRLPRYWLRARFGDVTVSIDGASLGSPSYAASVEGGPGAIYDKLEKVLLGPLREQFRKRSEE
jgi:hypothetical protein